MIEYGQAQATTSRLEVARAERAGAEQARSALRSKLYGLRSLFGDAVHRAVEAALEPYEERTYDGFRSYEEAISEAQQEARLANERHRQAAAAANARAEQVDLLSAELVRRHKRSRTEVPEWIALIRADFEAPF